MKLSCFYENNKVILSTPDDGVCLFFINHLHVNLFFEKGWSIGIETIYTFSSAADHLGLVVQN